MKLTSICALGALFLALPASAGTVRIHYDAGKDSIGVRSDGAWDKNVTANRSGDGVWTYSWPDSQGPVRMKPVLGADKLSVGAPYTVSPGATLDIFPFFGAPFGKVQIVENIASPQLKNTRKLRIYLPPSYEENKAKRYPVLYMHDGQNLFDPKTSAFGMDWGMSRTINHLIAMGQMDEVIVVGIDNTSERITEYTPCCDPKHGGGKLDDYIAFVADTVKPWADSHLRTLPTREHTAVLGSSLGGIASFAIAQRHPELFSMAGSLSGSFWWNERMMVKQAPSVLPVRFYLDAGTVNDGIEDTRAMHAAMLAKGYRDGNDLLYYQAEGATHNEKSWSERVDKVLLWFFAWGSTR